MVAVQNKGVDSLISFFWTRCGEFFSFEKLITRSSAKLQIEIFPLLEIIDRIFLIRGNFYQEFDSWKWLIDERIFEVEIALHISPNYKNYAWFKELYKRSIIIKLLIINFVIVINMGFLNYPWIFIKIVKSFQLQYHIK